MSSSSGRYKTDDFDIEAMDKEQEQAVFAAVRSGDEKLKDRLIQSGMAVVRELADEYMSSKVEYEDLFSEAVVALCEAVHDFDSATDERFSSYMTRRIQEGVQRCYSAIPGFMPIDYRVVQLHDRYELALLEIYPKRKDPENMAIQHEGYVADYLGVSLDELRAMKKEWEMCRIESLDNPVKLDESLPCSYEDNDIDNMSPLVETIIEPQTLNWEVKIKL